jgi:hypothetical protein
MRDCNGSRYHSDPTIPTYSALTTAISGSEEKRKSVTSTSPHVSAFG